MPEVNEWFTSPHTSQADGLRHEIRDEDFLAGMARGVYRALCDAQVAVVDVFGAPCQTCLTRLHEHNAAAAATSGSATAIPSQRPSLLRSLLGVV